MATRFYLPAEGSGTPNISPAFDAGWEQNGQATRLKLLRKTTLSVLSTIGANGTRTVPITTTQDILCNQFVSDPIPPQNIIGTVSFIIAALESAITANVMLAIVVKVVSQDGAVVRGTLFSNFNQDTEFATTQSTRIVNAQSVTNVITQPGDRIVLEVGGHAAAPTAATTYTMRQGDNNAADFALTSALTTDLNPWLEFSQNIYSTDTNNYQQVKVGDGLSTGEKIR